MSTNYTSIYDGGLLQTSEREGLTVEVQKNESNGEYSLKLWYMYLNEEGDWNYCNSMRGRGVLIKVDSMKKLNFLASTMTEAMKLLAKNPTLASDVKVTKTKATPPTKKVIAVDDVEEVKPSTKAKAKEVDELEEVALDFTSSIAKKSPSKKKVRR